MLKAGCTPLPHLTTHFLPRQALGEAHAFGRELVNVRGSDLLVPHAGPFEVTPLVEHEVDDVRFVGGLESGRDGEKKGEGKESAFHWKGMALSPLGLRRRIPLAGVGVRSAATLGDPKECWPRFQHD